MPYEKWKARLAGQKVETFVTPTADDEGYYRKPVTQKKLGADGKTNGQTEIIGYVPAAYFLDGETLVCLLGNKEVEAEDESLWSWVVANPISYEAYKAVAEEGKAWPDEATWNSKPVLLSENVGAVTDQPVKKVPETVEEHKALINTLIASTVDAKVDTDEEANSVQGSLNRLSDARLAATHAGEAVYKPHYAKYKAAYELWTPMVKDAEAEEKRLARLILTHREKVRKRELAEAAEAAKKKQEEEEAAARAADRAIANGEPPSLSEAPAEEEALPPPAPVSRITPTYGKKRVREQTQTFVEITDIDKLFAYFKETEEVKAVLRTLALVAHKAGREVPGISTREGLI